MNSVENLQWIWWLNLRIKKCILEEKIKKFHIKMKLLIHNLKTKIIYQTKRDSSKDITTMTMIKKKIRTVKMIFKLSVRLWKNLIFKMMMDFKNIKINKVFKRFREDIKMMAMKMISNKNISRISIVAAELFLRKLRILRREKKIRIKMIS